jgi:hypothetical protein
MNIVNFGCGPNPISGVDNIDGSFTVLFARLPLPATFFGSHKTFVDAVRKYQVRFGLGRSISFPDRSLDGFYSSHTLEHMPRRECTFLLSRVRSWLKPSGALRVALPDLSHFADRYNAGSFDADNFIEALNLAVDGLPWWRIAFGHTYHRWMYDVSSLGKLLSGLGYRQVNECSYGEGKRPELCRLDLR